MNPLGAPRRILVRLPNWVGDVVMATPALRALRRAHAEAEIVGLVRRYAAGVLHASPSLDRVMALDAKDEGGPLAAWRLSRRLAAEHFDAAVLLTNSFTSALPAWLSRIPRRVGYRGDARGALLTDRVTAPRTAAGKRTPEPMPAYYQRLLDAIGVDAAGPEYEIAVTTELRAAARTRLAALGRDPARPLVALNPGAKFGASKLWKPDRFAAVARGLYGDGADILVLAGPGEESLCRAVIAEAGIRALDTSREIIPLHLLGATLAEASLLVTTDSGPRHFAVAVGTPVVVVMGPTWPQWTAWNLERTEVLRHDVPCGPCHLKTCPTDHRCMELVSIDEVLAAARRKLAAPASRPRPA